MIDLDPVTLVSLLALLVIFLRRAHDRGWL